jgi:hypothetical protein
MPARVAKKKVRIFLLKVRERKAKLNWDANQTARVKTRLPEEPEPEPGG